MLKVGRPRPVRLLSSGRFYFGVMEAIFIVAEWLLLRYVILSIGTVGFTEWLSVENGIAVAGALALLAVMIGIPIRLRRQKRLVENGEITLGKVTKQWRARGNSWIQYEVTLGGATLKKETVDASHRLYAGMKVPVFYDAANLSRQIPCCAAYYEVILPSRD
jgi:hypothetical protein